MSEEVEEQLKKLESQEQRIFTLAKEINKEYTFQLDFLANTVLDRSLHLIFGFTLLIRDNNFICAAPIVRLHLDSLLRFSAAWLVSDAEIFAREIMNGKQIDKIKIREGKPLRDSYLIEPFLEEYPWVKNVYKETSGFIHLSKKHIFTSSKLKSEDERIIEFKISKKDNYVRDENRIEGILCMNAITDLICEFIETPPQLF